MAGRMVLLRHGATEWSLSGQHTGRTDIPLLGEGESQAEAAGAYLRAHGLGNFDLVLSSPLARAADTCRLAGFESQLEPDLMEWDYGEYEGIATRTSARGVRTGRSGSRASRVESGRPRWGGASIV